MRVLARSGGTKTATIPPSDRFLRGGGTARIVPKKCWREETNLQATMRKVQDRYLVEKRVQRGSHLGKVSVPVLGCMVLPTLLLDTPTRTDSSRNGCLAAKMRARAMRSWLTLHL